LRKNQLPRRPALGVALILALLLAGCGSGGPVTAGWAGMTVEGGNLYIAFRERVYAFTSGGIPLTNAPDDVIDPAWGPEGDRIAYAQKVDEQYQLFLYIFGQEPTQLTEDARDHRKPAFSPEADRLVYVADGDLYILNLDNREAEPVRLTETPGGEDEPDWSPTAGSIAYVSNEAGNADIHSIKPDGTDVQHLTRTTADEASPAWAPNGQRIAYVSDLDGNNDIYVINARGEGRTQLSENPADDVSPSWSADGAYLLFASDRDGNYDLYRMVADGSNVLQITQTEEDETQPHWQPGGPGSSGDRGDIIYLANATGTSQIHMTNTDQSQTISQPNWVYPTEPQASLQFYAPPTVAGNRLYVGGYDRRIHAFNLADGTPVTLDETDDEGNPLPWVTEQLEDLIADSVTVGENLIYVGVANRNVLAFRTAKPTLEWTFETEHGVWASPLLVDGTLYITSLDHHVYAVEAATGREIWRSERLTGAIPGRPAYDTVRQRMYVGTLDGKIHAIDADTGQLIDTYTAQDWVWGGPVLYDDTLYFADMAGWLYALDPDEWDLIWSDQVAQSGIRASPLVTEDAVYIAAQDNSLYARNRQDGKRMWKQEASGQLLSRPVYLGGLIIVSPMNADYLIAAYNEEGDLQWRYPPFQAGE
jgi:outer membrane protein assembly factor BamB